MEAIKGSDVNVPDAVFAWMLDGRGGVKPLENTDVIDEAHPCWLHLNYVHHDSAQWLATTPLLPNNVRDALAGESTRPRVSRLGEGTLITLRCINGSTDERPDQLVAMRVYMDGRLIVSTRQRKVLALDDVVSDLEEGTGPTDCGGWLVDVCDALTDPNAQLQELATRIEAQGFRPYVIPVGGSNALGALGYVESALEIAQQCEGAVALSSVVVASGSAGTHAGLAVGLEQLMPDVELIGVTVSRSVADQKPKVVTLQQDIARELELTASADILLWDDYFAPGYGTPNEEGMEAVKLLARLEGILLDPVYTGKAMAGLIDGISQKRFKDEGPILFIHTGGAPALFAYHPHV